MKRIVELALLIALIGAGFTLLFFTGKSKIQDRMSGSHTSLDRSSVSPEKRPELNPAEAVKLAPFIPTPMCVVERMLELADVDGNDIVYDLGCGDGRIVITAAKKYGAKGVGLDIYPQWVKKSQLNAKRAGVESLVHFRLEDATKADISDASVVAFYLLPETNELLRSILEDQLKPGARVVSHNYHMPGWSDKEVCVEYLEDELGKEHTIFVYRL